MGYDGATESVQRFKVSIAATHHPECVRTVPSLHNMKFTRCEVFVHVRSVGLEMTGR